jgi:hypothetical protein
LPPFGPFAITVFFSAIPAISNSALSDVSP